MLQLRGGTDAWLLPLKLQYESTSATAVKACSQRVEVALRDAWDRLSIYANCFMRRLQLVAEMHAAACERASGM